MKKQPNRLEASSEHRLSGTLIDRSRPLRFTLNGREFDAFEGDTVLSALLAGGVDTAGTRFGDPLALNARFAPPVIPTALMDTPERMLPIERTQVVEGMELRTIGGPDELGRTLIGRLFRSRSLGQIYDHSLPFPGAWVDLEATETVDTDVLVIGGGIAGLSTAYRALNDRKRVVLVERSAALGGEAEFYGGSEGEKAPREAIETLAGALKSRNRMTVLTHAEAISLSGGAAFVHQVIERDGWPDNRLLHIRADACILATGAPERLPVFAGNRLAGVTGAIGAYQLARRYGVWPGRNAAFSISVNSAYRLAMLASEAGIEIRRLTDTRLEQYSAYLGYAQAVSAPMTPGLFPVEARQAGRNGDLDLKFAVAHDESTLKDEQIRTTRFITARPSQPDLVLWLKLGGRLEWDERRQEFAAKGSLPGVFVAGAAAGYRSFSACLKSGEAVADLLSERKPKPIEDLEEDASPGAFREFDAENAHESSGVAYLDGGASLAVQTRHVSQRSKRLGGGQNGDDRQELMSDTRALSIGDIAARIRLGEIQPEKASTVIAERCVVAHRIGPETDPGVKAEKSPQNPLDAPDYLTGRFGTKPRRWTARAEDGRRLATGSLVFARSDLDNPEDAVGVVLGEGETNDRTCVVLIDAGHAWAGDHVIIRDMSGHSGAILEQAFESGSSKGG